MEEKIIHMEKNLPFLHYIIGDKDGKPVIKVFIQSDDKDEKKVKVGLKKAYFPFERKQIIFFNIDKQSESISNEAEKIQREEENSIDLDESTRTLLEKIIDRNQNDLYKRFSSIIGIGISNVRYNRNTFVKEPCIVLYCLDKNIVPFWEKSLPTVIEGWPCDHRENIALRKHFFLFDKLLSDHNFVVKSWKRKDMPDTTVLENTPSIQDYIIGVKGDTTVIKAFISGDDDEKKRVEDELNKTCVFSKDISIEIVNIDEQSESDLNEAEEIQRVEKISTNLNESTRTQLEKVIKKKQNYLYKRYSNIIGIGKSNVRYDGKTFVKDPCIVLYCLDKHIIPFGEGSLPTFFEGWPCDHREEFFMLESCPSPCPSRDYAFPELGCSIGPDLQTTGSVGFMVQSQNNSKKTGFLTAAHVAVKDLNKTKLHFPKVKLEEITKIKHPSNADDEKNSKEVGKVVEAYYGTYDGRGLDVAYVENYCSRESMIIIIFFIYYFLLLLLLFQ